LPALLAMTSVMQHGILVFLSEKLLRLMNEILVCYNSWR